MGNGLLFDQVLKTLYGTLLSSKRHLINVQASDGFQRSSGVYKLKIEVTEADPMAAAGLPVFANATLRCLVVRRNMTIEWWARGEQKMFDFSLCMDQAYTR